MILQRENLGRDGAATRGELTSGNGFACRTLERSVNGEHPCIPAGTYTVRKDIHHPGTARSYPCPELQDVPERDQIQIHIANRVDQILGCIAVGEHYSKDLEQILDSADAFDNLMEYIGGGFPFSLTIKDPVGEEAKKLREAGTGEGGEE